MRKAGNGRGICACPNGGHIPDEGQKVITASGEKASVRQKSRCYNWRVVAEQSIFFVKIWRVPQHHGPVKANTGQKITLLSLFKICYCGTAI